VRVATQIETARPSARNRSTADAARPEAFVGGGGDQEERTMGDVSWGQILEE